MNLHLAPTHHCELENGNVLWHQASNKYSIVERNLFILLDAYFKAVDSLAFKNTLLEVFDISNAEAIILESQITTLLEAANTTKGTIEKAPIAPHLTKQRISTTYKAYRHIFQIITDNSELLYLVNPALAHLKIETNIAPKAIFYINEVAGYLHLFLDGEHCGCFPKAEYHLLQGRFVMLLLGVLHNIPDENWLASFHASTVAKYGNAVMLTGASGKGKSTLTALLAFNNFEFVCDDVSGMLATDHCIYNYPAAISIKSGAFNTLNQTIPEFKDLTTETKHHKGKVKFLPVAQPKARKYPCNKLVLVHYCQQPITARLEKIPTSKALESLIPDTWISPQPEHAKAFLEWLPNIKAYELHYHNIEEVIQILEDLLKS